MRRGKNWIEKYLLKNSTIEEGDNMIHCSNCGAENPPDSKYCENCGTMLRTEESLSKPILRIISAGLLVAFIGGLIWSLIIVVTGYEIGFMATGLGAAAGIIVTKFGEGFKLSIIRSVAIGSSILGIFVGKFTAFYYIFVQTFREILIAEGLTEVEASFVSPSLGLVFKTFIQNIPELFGVFGLIWVILALIAAWRLPGTASKKM